LNLKTDPLYLCGERRFMPPIVLAILVLAGVGSSPVLATGDQSAGVTGGEVSRFKGWEVSSFEVRGMDPVLIRDIDQGLALQGQKGLIRSRRALLFADVLTADTKRVLAFAARHGYPGARIRVLFEPNPKSRKVGIIFEVEQGPAAIVVDLSAPGMPDIINGSKAYGAPLTVGRRFTEPDLEMAILALEEAMGANGYPFAKVTPKVVLSDSSRVSVALNVTPGPLCIITGVRVTGAAPDLEPLVRRNIRGVDGLIFTNAALRDARRNTRELDLFRRVDVSVSEPRDDKVELLVDLLPRKERLAEVDLGYWTDDFLRAGARWRHRNLLGGGRGVEVRGTLSRFRRDGALNVWWLSPFGPRTRMTTRLNHVLELEDGYDLTSNQAEFWVSKRLGRRGRLQCGLAVADVDLRVSTSDPTAFLAESGQLTSLHLRADLEHVDDPINPTRGHSWSGGVEWSPPWFPSDNNFLNSAVKVAWYRSIGGAVLASRLEAGLARPLGESVDLLPNKRFFAGGSSTMRGARRRMLGPLDVIGSPVGGEAMLLGSTELRWHLKGLVSAVIFADLGNVWRTASDVTFDGLSLAVGPGLMIGTPVGPVRADVGFNTSARPAGEPSVVLHVSVGHPF